MGPLVSRCIACGATAAQVEHGPCVECGATKEHVCYDELDLESLGRRAKEIGKRCLEILKEKELVN